MLSLLLYYSATAQLAMQSAVLAIVNPSLCPSVRPSVRLSHAGTVSKQLKTRYDHAVFTVGQPHDSSFLRVNFSAKSQMGTWGARAPNERGVGKIGIFSQ